MQTKIYLSDEIPDGYIYGQVTNDYIDLFNKSTFQGETATFYRIYYHYNGGLVQSGTRTFSSYSPTTFGQLPVSRDIFDYPCFDSCVLIVFIITLALIWLTNLFTSIVRKGGGFSGLL